MKNISYLMIFILSLITMAANAADIKLQIDADRIVVDQPFQITFIVKGTQSAEPDFSPMEKDFSLHGTSTSSQFSMVNGSTSQSLQYQLTLTSKQVGDFIIPAISFGHDMSNERSITVVQRDPATQQNESADMGDTLFIVAEVDNQQPYVQQQVVVTLKIYRRMDWQRASLSDLNTGSSDVLSQQLGEDKNYRTEHNGKTYLVVERRYALFPQQSGSLTLAPFSLTALVAVGKKNRSTFNGAFPGLFSRGNYEQKTVSSDAIRLHVKPKPDAFTGNHWLVANELTLQENWSKDPKSLTVGDSVTRTLALIADGVSVGMLPQIQLPDVNGLKIYPDQPETHEQAVADGLLSSSTYKFALVPARAGAFSLPEVKVPWWNVKTQQMQIASLPAVTLQVAAGDTAIVQQTPITPIEPLVKNNTDEVASPALETVSENSLNYWLVAGMVLFAMLWLLTLLAWYRGRSGINKAQSKAMDAAFIEPSLDLKTLEQSCQEKDPAATRQELLVLAKILWHEANVSSIEDMQQLVNPKLASALNALNNHLYGSGQADWQPEIILSEMTHLVKQRKSSKNLHKNESLAPLFKTA